MAERSHWWTGRWLRSPLFLFLSFAFSDYLPTYSLPLCPSVYLSISLSIYLPIHPSSYLSIQLSIYLSIYRSIDRSIYLSIYLFVCLSIYLSICKLGNQAILRDFFILQNWHHQKRSNSARLPQCLNFTTSKTKQFCETSSFLEVDNIKNEAILRHFFIFWTRQHPKRSNSASPIHFLN